MDIDQIQIDTEEAIAGVLFDKELVADEEDAADAGRTALQVVVKRLFPSEFAALRHMFDLPLEV